VARQSINLCIGCVEKRLGRELNLMDFDSSSDFVWLPVLSRNARSTGLANPIGSSEVRRDKYGVPGKPLETFGESTAMMCVAGASRTAAPPNCQSRPPSPRLVIVNQPQSAPERVLVVQNPSA